MMFCPQLSPRKPREDRICSSKQASRQYAEKRREQGGAERSVIQEEGEKRRESENATK